MNGRSPLLQDICASRGFVSCVCGAAVLLAACALTSTKDGTPAATLPLPPGWILTPPPSPRELECARFGQPWTVKLEKGALVVLRGRRGDVVPLDLRPLLKSERGFLSVVPVKGGYLVGSEFGEFGGALRWYGTNGARITIRETPVLALLVLDSKTAVSLSARAASSKPSATLTWLVAQQDGTWAATRDIEVAVRVEAASASPGGFDVVTPDGIVRILPSGTVHEVARVDWQRLGIISVMRTQDDTLWVGAQHYVLTLPPAPDGKRRSVKWATRASCRTVQFTGVQCLCEDER